MSLNHQPHAPYKANSSSPQLFAAFGFGAVFSTIILILAYVFPHPTAMQYVVSRILLALSSAGIATMLTGFLEINIPNVLKGGGALAVFGVVYFYTPADLVISELGLQEPEKVNRLSDCATALGQRSPIGDADILTSYATSRDPEARVVCELALNLQQNGTEENSMYASALVREGRLEEALARFIRAAGLGDVYSDLVLGYYFELYKEKDSVKSLKYFNEANSKGSVEAAIALGKIYEMGIFAAPDYAKAALFYESTLKSEDVEAEYRLGQLLEHGLGVSKDISKAKDLYRQAAGKGYRPAVEALNDMAHH